MLADLVAHGGPNDGGDVLTRGGPKPHPDLKQVPPM
jgi:hypothetical protein